MDRYKFLIIVSLMASYALRAMNYEYTDNTSVGSSNQAIITYSNGAEILQSNLEIADSVSRQCVITQQRLNKLSSVEIGIILCQLSNQVGTQGFINKKDIAVIIKNVHNLATVNKQLYANVNNYIATNLLINSMAERFKMSPVDIAALIKTKATQEWLKQYVHKNGDYELFKVVQNIFAICGEIRQQIKLQYNTEIWDGQKSWPGVNPCYNQTKQGLMLTSESSPDLLTPWGEIKLFAGGYGSPLGFLAVQQELLKRVSAEKIKDSGYKIHRVGESQLPDPEMMPYAACRSYEALKAIWKIMDDEFHNRSEQSQASSSSSYSYKPESRIYPVPYQVVPAIEVTNINDIPEQYIKLLSYLLNQPIFTGQGCIVKQAKVITCESWDDCKITELLIQSANEHLNKERQWHLHTSGCGNSQLYFENQCLGNGLQLWIYENNIPCSFEILKNNFALILNKLKNGWEQSTLIENQDILHTESEEEWFLFVKKDEYEDTLIRFLASKFKLNKKMSCHNWYNEEKHKNEIYLWVRKDAIDEVRNVLDLHI